VSDTKPQSTAVLLIAHGSRRKEANDDLVRLAEIVRQRRPDVLVEASYLELASPSIPEGARNCIEQGAQKVLMLPYFLSAGAHVVSDLQRFRDELAAEFPDAEFTLCPPLGLHPLMADIVFDRLQAGESDKGT
jgi:sirohydrochlorin ferrochelatase